MKCPRCLTYTLPVQHDMEPILFDSEGTEVGWICDVHGIWQEH